MGGPWLLPLLLGAWGLGLPPGARVRAQGDFDLADALEDPDPTKKPNADIYPRPRPPPPRPAPGYPDGGDIYPRPKPPPPRPPPGYPDGGGGGGYNPNQDGYGGSHGGGGGGYNTYGDPHGNTVARIVSPIVSVVVVTLVGAAVGYFQRNRRRNCFRPSQPEHV